MNKDSRIYIRINSNKKKKYLEKCAHYNISGTQYIRSAIDVFIGDNAYKEYELHPQTIDKRKYKKMLNEDRWIENSRQLRRIGVNLNQAVKNLNFLIRSGFYEERPDELNQVINNLKTIGNELDIRKKTLDTFIDESRRNV